MDDRKWLVDRPLLGSASCPHAMTACCVHKEPIMCSTDENDPLEELLHMSHNRHLIMTKVRRIAIALDVNLGSMRLLMD